jgi:outer membrane protein assembly factor BamB
MLGWMRSSDWTFAGQRLWALDLATGNVVWQSSSYPAVRDPGGHISGTAIVDGANAVVVLPLAGKMVALDLKTGVTRCSISTNASFDRDGPTVADSALYFGSVGGVMYAMPISMLAGCEAPAVMALVH